MSQTRVGEIAGYKIATAASRISRMELGSQLIPAGLIDKLQDLLKDKKLGNHGRMAT
jgi:hypothetical protein